MTAGAPFHDISNTSVSATLPAAAAFRPLKPTIAGGTLPKVTSSREVNSRAP